MAKQEVEAGLSTQLAVTVTGNSRASTSALVAIKSNDPEKPVVKIVARYRSDSPFELRPRRLDFGDLSREQLPYSMEAILAANRLDTERISAKLDDTSLSSEWVTVSLQEGKKTNELLLLATVLPGAPAGEMLGTIEICARGKVVGNVELYAYVRSAACMRVDAVVLDLGDERSDGNRYVDLPMREGALPWKVERISVSESLMNIVEANVASRNVKAPIRIQLTAVMPRPSIARPVIWGNICVFLRAGSEQKEIVLIPVRVAAPFTDASGE